MSERGKKQGKSLREWYAERLSLTPLYVQRNASLAYLAAERQELEKLPPEIYRWDKNTVCPGSRPEAPIVGDAKPRRDEP